MDHDEYGATQPHIQVHRNINLCQFVGWYQAASMHVFLILRVYNLCLGASHQAWLTMLLRLTSIQTQP